MTYRYRSVERVPKVMEAGVVYHSQEFELAGLLCACGCGHQVTLLVPDSHQVTDQDGWATVSPSIGVFDAPCKSHFIIRAGHVHWMPAFSAGEAASIMRAQVARHVAQDRKPLSLWARILAWIAGLFGGSR